MDFCQINDEKFKKFYRQITTFSSFIHDQIIHFQSIIAKISIFGIKRWLTRGKTIKSIEFFLEFIGNSKLNLYNKYLTFQFKMSKRNWRKFSQKVRKVSAEPEKRYKQKPEKRWQCRICHSFNEDTQAFCVQCFLGLHYYAYVNMHMFVVCDNSFQTIYYPTKHSQTNSDSMSQHSSQSEQQVEREAEDIKIDWVEDLLQDQ